MDRPLKIAWVSDTDLIGSGYMNLTVALGEGLSKRGHKVSIAGLGYSGAQHNYDFQMIPATNVREAMGLVQNLYNMNGFDVLVVALDVPLQESILYDSQGRPFKYVGIMPIEAPPVCVSWSHALLLMDGRLVISQFGTEEMRKVGLEAEHLQIGIDTESWRPPTEEEKASIRENIYGIDKDVFVVLTVADNQERKNLSASMDIFKEFRKYHKNSKYMLVTRERNFAGWRLRDYAQEIGILSDFMVFERGMPFKQLWTTYAAADAFLLPSKAEGLGLPLLEAMSMRIPCIATKCTGMKELLGDGRGILVDYSFTHRDCFGNGMRYWIDVEDGIRKLSLLADGLPGKEYMLDEARSYMETRKWDIAVDTLEKMLYKVVEKGKTHEE
jgi:glycosyltransferase involved in cell wall biosynthesis